MPEIKHLSAEIEAPVEAISALGTSRLAEICPYCQSKNFVKRGLRQNQYQSVQLYLCKNEECNRTFTAQDVKGKHFPLNVVIEAMSYYNLGFSLEETCRIIAKKFSVPVPRLSGVEPEGPAPDSSTSAAGSFVAPTPSTLSGWIDEYKELCRYERLRPYAVKMCKPKDTIEVVSMAHRQLYRFRYHRPKTALMLTEFKNRNLRRLQEYLNAVSSETPHQYFQDGERMSDVRSKFSTADMIVKSKNNYANRLAKFVLQTVSENKARHEALQRFFIANDSCTVATEVPVYIRKEDIEHMENILKFKVIGEEGLIFKNTKTNPSPTLPEGEGEMPRFFTTNPELWKALQDRALEMRKNPTDVEKIMWDLLRRNNPSLSLPEGEGKNPKGFHFRRQHIIDRFIIDFVCIEKRLVVEVDGDIHDYKKSEDQERTKILNQLGFEVMRFSNNEVIKSKENVLDKIILKLNSVSNSALSFGEGLGGVDSRKHLPKLLTGHIDLIQIRNGQVHIMDYKPGAAKERPIEQLTWYALALSRLTGLRLFEFTCAWFDEKDYFQFFPLHVVKKIQTKAVKPRRRMIQFKDGTKAEVPRENPGKVVVV